MVTYEQQVNKIIQRKICSNATIKKYFFVQIGHTLHEWTSFTAFDVIFRFFKEERQKLERS